MNASLTLLLFFFFRYSELPVFKLFHSAAVYLPKAMCGEASMVEQLVSTPEWVTYYEESIGPKQAADQLGDAVHQLVNRYPRAKILEVGKQSPPLPHLSFGSQPLSFLE